MIDVLLTVPDLDHATSVGLERYDYDRERCLEDRWGKDSEASHILGARGELAAAKALGIPWEPSLGSFRRFADLGADIEVRTRSNPRARLDHYTRDALTLRLVLVVTIHGGELPAQAFRVIGWLPATDCRRPEWWEARTGCWRVPQTALRDPHELRQPQAEGASHADVGERRP